MSILQTILGQTKAQKTHIIYGTILLTVVLAGYRLFHREPVETIKTVTQVQYVNRDVVRVQKQFIDRVIVKKEKNGTTITTTEHVHNDNSTVDKTKTLDKLTTTEINSYLAKYSFSSYYSVPMSISGVPTFDPKNLTLIGGYRVLDTPLFLNLGTTGAFNQILIGVTLEL